MSSPQRDDRAARSFELLTVVLLACAACAAKDKPNAAAAAVPAQAFALNVTSVDTSFRTRDHFIASVEMQLSGEPFAEAMGRVLGGYSRDYTCQDSVCSPDTYLDPAAVSGDAGASLNRVDLAGFSTAIESYEYSKQPMNNLAFESGAGTSLLFGPVLNPDGLSGTAALQLAHDWMLHLGGETNTTKRFVDGAPLGWAGLWPTLQPFSSWDPAIAPTNDAGCSLTSDDNPGAHGALLSDDYECDYDSLHLPDRVKQVSMTIDPGSSGWSAWKEALWTLNYLQLLHNVDEMPVAAVQENDLPTIGLPGNTVGFGLHPGIYLGSSNIEGFQAGNFIQILDNQAAQWLSSLSTSDGATLDGFASLTDALAYNQASPLRWFPASISVLESDDASGFPRPSAYAIASSDSHLLDLAGLLGAYASAYALTDRANRDVGGSQPVRAYFDGDPFPVQNQTPDGENTLHDRALAMLRVLLVDIDRLHVDPASGAFADDAAVSGGVVSRGKVLSSDVAAYTLLALRTARRALDSQLTLYSNTTPDTAGIPSPLDAFALQDDLSYGQRLTQLVVALSDMLYDKLTTADGRAYAGWDLARSTPTDKASSLDAHSAALRGLLTAYLATGAPKFRDRALLVWKRLDATFYDPSARVYRSVAADHGAKVTFTPRRFAVLQGALRDTYELVATLPGKQALRALLEDRVGRLNKLVLNGWDDRNQDQLIEWPRECSHMGSGPDGQPLGLGGLQMGERTLTGESGSLPDTDGTGQRVIATDREHDCVPEISAAHLPAALASSITFTLTPMTAEDRALPPSDAGVAR